MRLAATVFVLGIASVLSQDDFTWSDVNRGAFLPFDQDESVFHVLTSKTGFMAFSFTPVQASKVPLLMAINMQDLIISYAFTPPTCINQKLADISNIESSTSTQSWHWTFQKFDARFDAYLEGTLVFSIDYAEDCADQNGYVNMIDKTVGVTFINGLDSASQLYAIGPIPSDQNPEPTTNGFMLVDEQGRNLDPSNEDMGLLLWNGQTVCDDEVDEAAAHAICREMGYPGALSWTSYDEDDGFSPFDIRNEYSIGMDDVSCTSTSWDSCTYVTSNNCNHNEDVHLRCGTPEEPNAGFRLIDEDGNSLFGETITGLLLWNGRTVCDDDFDMNAAHAICREMGYQSATGWTSTDEDSDGLEYSIRFNFFIGMDDVICDSDTWDSCSYDEDDNCDHDEDVYLSCTQRVYESCTWDWNAYEETHCCDHPDYYYDSKCTSGAERGQLISLFTIATTAVITALFL